jgi:hypothetical protein
MASAIAARNADRLPFVKDNTAIRCLLVLLMKVILPEQSLSRNRRNVPRLETIPPLGSGIDEDTCWLPQIDTENSTHMPYFAQFTPQAGGKRVLSQMQPGQTNQPSGVG